MTIVSVIRSVVFWGVAFAASAGNCWAVGLASLSPSIAEEYRVITDQIKEFRRHPEAQDRLLREALREAALIVDEDRDPLDVVLRRCRALLTDLRTMPSPPNLDAEVEALDVLAEEARRLQPGDDGRLPIFQSACGLRRRVAFANPLLDFKDILFLKHGRARYEHMVDQYYGFHAEHGGGVYVLENAFGEQPTVRDLLKESVVANGRLQGRTLSEGSFISLDLDYDAETVLFAFTEAEVPVKPEDLTPQEELWKPGSTYHVFRAATDGSALTQLTDGVWNDFDPCWLPNGRVAFVSERRGGFLRCGLRPNPTYTLHSMRADGSDLFPLSYHETHEWHPSVNNDGMIVYSRWDYVDRDSDIAHHLWLTYPDGRDPRSMHGNYPSARESRPWMELSIRAVPGSQNYVAVSTPHHGQNYGSIVLIDLQLPDDGAMSQIKRVTPDTAFPEAELSPAIPGKLHGGRNNGKWERYGTPWPLSDIYYLCVYDLGQSNYGLYLLDAFGNRELLYRDTDMACLDPIPLRARKRPPVLPARTLQASDDREGEAPETGYVTILDIYDSELPWPPNTEITDVRVIQIFPKTTPGSEDPNIGVGAQSIARGVLGTAPVEEDGSVYCEVPAGVPVYFQALDRQGRAVQTMRSNTYVHPGETLSCVGCHEDKRRSPALLAKRVPLALQREASILKPEAEGSFPLQFTRLVQPVIDAHCVACHAEKEDAPKLDGNTFGEWGWSQSYHALSQFAWAKHGGNGALERNGTSFSIAGEVGARASALLRILEEGHYDVQLPEEDLRRLVVWMDCNSVFYGAYDEIIKQARGDLVLPSRY